MIFNDLTKNTIFYPFVLILNLRNLRKVQKKRKHAILIK